MQTSTLLVQYSMLLAHACYHMISAVEPVALGPQPNTTASSETVSSNPNGLKQTSPNPTHAALIIETSDLLTSETVQQYP